MLHSEIRKQLAMGSLATAMFAAGQGAFAHTTIEATATEGTAAYNSVQIGHVCKTPSGKRIPVIAQVAVFPTNDTTSKVLTLDDTKDGSGNYKSPTNTTLVLSDVVDTTKNLVGLAGLADFVQDKNVFSKQDEIYDNPASATPNLIGFYGRSGRLQWNLRARIPFRFSPPAFKTTGPGACVNTLKVKIAVADICKVTAHPAEGDANIWIPNANAVFTNKLIDGVDPTFVATGISGGENSGAPATLTINRKVPITDFSACPALGGSAASASNATVDVWPTNAWVEQNLKIPGYWTPAP